ncbi:hypothetical protein GN956_G23493 [Arapaima gigas]
MASDPFQQQLYISLCSQVASRWSSQTVAFFHLTLLVPPSEDREPLLLTRNWHQAGSIPKTPGGETDHGSSETELGGQTPGLHGHKKYL